MISKPVLLSVLIMLVSFINIVRADSFLLPVKSSICVDVIASSSRSDIRFKAYDKAAFVAVKSSSYMKEKANILEDHNYNEFAYKIIDYALNDISLITTKDDDEKICLELSGIIDVKKADELLLSQNTSSIETQNVYKIANEINETLPKPLDETIPLIYIQDIEFYNNTTSSAYKKKMAEKLSFNPKILVTDNKELADYYIVPKLLLSKSEKINDDNSRFSMSIIVELQRANGVVVHKEEKNRYIIITKQEDTQEIAQKLLIKLLEDALMSMSKQLNNLSHY